MPNITDAVSEIIAFCSIQTIQSALEIIRRTNQLGYVPELVARPFIKSKEIVQIELPAIRTVLQPVYLTVKNDLLSQKMFAWLIQICARELSV